MADSPEVYDPNRPFAAFASDPALVADFILESREHLSAIEGHLLVLEQDPANTEAIHTIFRGFHTIKGLAGFLELDAVREVAHEIETVLDAARNGIVKIGPDVADVILQSADFLNRSITVLEAGLQGNSVPLTRLEPGLLASIRAVLDGPRTQETATPKASEVIPPPPPPPPVEEPRADIPSGPATAPASPKPESHDGAPVGHASAAESRSVKVNTQKLDRLVELVGEMVIAQALVRHDPNLAVDRNSSLSRNLSQLSRIINEVQETSMSMRMVPIGQLFSKMQRLVRDLGRKMGKSVEMVMEGDQTELDRRIVEELADPMMHMIRNAVDHGIEDSQTRKEAGKSETATVMLRAAHQGGQIVIEIIDDGRGLNLEKIRRTGINRGLIDENAEMTDSEVANLILVPGFSTADKVTDISGRGVGMDVVKRQIQQLRGRIEIHSSRGKGTTFALKLPLTLAIIDGLLVRVGVERYVIPIVSVRELLRPDAKTISMIQGRGEVALVRGEALPIVRLYQRFGVRPSNTEAAQSLLVIAEGESARFCIMVDELIGKQEVVIKSLGESFKDLPGVAGGAILGDGRAGLILDVDGLFGGHRNGQLVQAC